MKIDLNELNYKDEIIIKDKISFKKEEIVLSEIKDIKDASLDCRIFYDLVGDIKIEGIFLAILILIDANDLSDFPYQIKLNIDEKIENEQNILDINSFLWENIVLEVPIRVTRNSLDKKKGQGWEIKNN